MLRHITLLLLLLLALVPDVSARQAEVRVVYSVQEVRSGRFISHVSLTNMTASPIRAWTLSFRLADPVDQMDNVVWNRFGDIYDVQGAGWTHEIQPGGVAFFTIHGVTSGPNAPTPTACSFNGVTCTVEGATVPQEPTVDLRDLIVASWIGEQDQTTYTGYIVIRNPTAVDLDRWRLTFTTSSLITRMEHVNWTRSGSTYQVDGLAETSRIRAGEFIFFSFSGVHNGTPALPQGCSVNGTGCEFTTPDRVIETPRINLFMKVDKITSTVFEGYIELQNPSEIDLSSWTLRFTFDDRITMVGGEVKWSRSDKLYTLQGMNGRQRILRGTSIVFPIAGTFEDEIEPPLNCTVNGVLCLIDAEGTTVQPDETADGGTGGGDTGGGDDGGGDDGGGDDGGGDDGGGTATCEGTGGTTTAIPEIDFRFLSVTASQYVALIKLTNTSGGVVRGWSLSFGLMDGMTITRHWSSVMTQNQDGTWLATNQADNDCIPSGGSVEFGFNGTHTGNFGDPIGCQFGTASCVFLRAQSVGTEKTRPTPLQPGGVDLAGVWPNPFNPMARMEFESYTTQRVVAGMWDMLGRHVAVLHDGMVAAGERKTVQIDGSGLPSGTYIVRIVGQNGQTVSRAVSLLK